MRKYILLKKDHLPYIDFSEVIENEDTIVQLEKDNEIYFVVKWDREPTFLENIEYIGPMIHSEMLEYLNDMFYKEFPDIPDDITE